MDPYWFGSLVPNPDPHWDKKLNPSAVKPVRIHNNETFFCCPFFLRPQFLRAYTGKQHSFLSVKWAVTGVPATNHQIRRFGFHISCGQIQASRNTEIFTSIRELSSGWRPGAWWLVVPENRSRRAGAPLSAPPGWSCHGYHGSIVELELRSFISSRHRYLSDVQKLLSKAHLFWPLRLLLLLSWCLQKF